MIAIPLMQLLLFGYRHQLRPEATCRPCCRCRRSERPFGRAASWRRSDNTDYLDLRGAEPSSDAEFDATVAGHSADAQIVIKIPEDFSRELRRGERPTRADRGRRLRPGRHRPGGRSRDRRARRHGAFNRDLRGRSPPLAGTDGRCSRWSPSTRAIQPGRGDPAQHRARADGHRPHDDLGDDHRALGHPRARARHDGGAAGHARCGRIEVMLGKILPYIAVGYPPDDC
jgi:hypothetical protein